MRKWILKGTTLKTPLALLMTSLLPRLEDVSKMICFSVLILECQQVTHIKTLCEGKPG